MTATYLFWDIDGTLITTGGAGPRAWERAAAELLGRDDGLAGIDTSGVSDAQIAVQLCRVAGVRQANMPSVLLEAIERLLPEELAAGDGRVLPNVRENLEALSEREDVVNMLLTGNVAANAWSKLEFFGLSRFFGAGGAFSVEGTDRAGIARRARSLAAEHAGGELAGEQMVVIGDTPHDIACGKAIGARTVGVASGRVYRLADLERAKPWRAFAALPDPARLLAALGLD
jgi:phosphoglycolate phosphatase-like HAD superfamily hydrolase